MNLKSHLVAWIVFASSLAHAEWSSRNRFELGATDNAVLSTVSKQSDLFLSASTKNTFTSGQNALGFRLGYRDYNKENSNDLLSWGLFDEFKCLTIVDSCEIEFKGREYTYAQPMNTDFAFNSYALQLTAKKSRPLRERATLDLLGAYEIKNYYLINRTDHTVLGRGTIGYESNRRIYFEGTGESGLVLSSSGEYSALFAELSGLADFRTSEDWNFIAEKGLKKTLFLSRDLATETQMTRRNGRVVSRVDTSKETYNMVYVSAEANRRLSSTSSTGLMLRNYTQSSQSGYQDYQETEILAKLLLNY